MQSNVSIGGVEKIIKTSWCKKYAITRTNEIYEAETSYKILNDSPFSLESYCWIKNQYPLANFDQHALVTENFTIILQAIVSTKINWN